MYIDSNTIISIAALLGAVLAIGGVLLSVLRWIERQNRQDADIKAMKEEQALITETLFSVLDGLKQLGCNGNVTSAHDKLREHLNKSAHEV